MKESAFSLWVDKNVFYHSILCYIVNLCSLINKTRIILGLNERVWPWSRKLPEQGGSVGQFAPDFLGWQPGLESPYRALM